MEMSQEQLASAKKQLSDFKKRLENKRMMLALQGHPKREIDSLLGPEVSFYLGLEEEIKAAENGEDTHKCVYF